MKNYLCIYKFSAIVNETKVKEYLVILLLTLMKHLHYLVPDSTKREGS